jgi:hypothetical protein
MAIHSGATFASLGVTAGTYVWSWGPGANQNFTLQILSAKLPAPKVTNISTRASVQTVRRDHCRIDHHGNGREKSSDPRPGSETLGQSPFNVPAPLAYPMLRLYDNSGALI